MRSIMETVATAIGQKAHSFDHIRSSTGLKLTDEQFVSIIEKNPARFKLVHFVKRDDEGTRILPGRPGVRLKPDPA
jgi:hypothetical protein